MRVYRKPNVVAVFCLEINNPLRGMSGGVVLFHDPLLIGIYVLKVPAIEREVVPTIVQYNLGG